MKHRLTILAIFFIATVLGQSKDTRAELQRNGPYNIFCVSPDEKILLVSSEGETFFTDNIKSNWHYGKPVFKKTNYLFETTDLEKIVFFNTDIAIMIGKILTTGWKANVIYLTKDGGQTWTLTDFKGNFEIDFSLADKNGNAWLIGSSKELYYSDNYGEMWKTIKLPYGFSESTSSLDMINSLEGIAGSENNEILITKDNWKTITKIPTPLDQKRYRKTKKSGYIGNILIFGKYYIINQDEHLYFTDKNEINWKEFPIKIVDFEMDRRTNKLFAITKDLQVISLLTPENFNYISGGKTLLSIPWSVQAVDSSLFAIDNSNNIYKINSSEFTRIIPYTIDHKIPASLDIKKFKKLTWGISSNNQIYLSENNGKDWFREGVIDKIVCDYNLISDSLAILWDCHETFLYSLESHKLEPYIPVKPLDSFLQSPIVSFSINLTSGNLVKKKIEYTKFNDTLFTTTNISKIEYSGDEWDKKPYKNTEEVYKKNISGKELQKILNSINSNPAYSPGIKDFGITEQDKKNYLKLVDSLVKEKNVRYSIKKNDAKFFYSIPDRLNSIDSSIISKIFHQYKRVSYPSFFYIELTNKNNETLKISRSFTEPLSWNNLRPWNLPWRIEYKELHLNCYDISFSKYINDCVPMDFMDREVFNNKFLIMQIAEHLKEIE